MLEYKQYQQVNLNTEELHTFLASAVVEQSDFVVRQNLYQNTHTGGVHETSVSTSVKTNHANIN